MAKKVSENPSENKWAIVAWALLLLGGLAHLIPAQLAPVFGWSLYGVTLQSVVGFVSVVMALYFLLGKE